MVFWEVTAVDCITHHTQTHSMGKMQRVCMLQMTVETCMQHQDIACAQFMQTEELLVN